MTKSKMKVVEQDQLKSALNEKETTEKVERVGTPTDPNDENQGFKRYRVQFDFNYKGHEGSPNNGEIITQPDMSLTIRQLLTNHTRGTMGAVEHDPIYFEQEIPQVSDITDVYAFRQSLQERLHQTEEFIRIDKERAQKAAELEEQQPQKDKKNGHDENA